VGSSWGLWVTGVMLSKGTVRPQQIPLSSFLVSSGHEVSHFTLAMVGHDRPKSMGPTDCGFWSTSNSMCQNKPFIFVSWLSQVFIIVTKKLTNTVVFSFSWLFSLLYWSFLVWYSSTYLSCLFCFCFCVI
jgi:hypothetical protein